MKNIIAIDRMYKKLEEYTDKKIKELTRAELDAFVKLITKGLSYTTTCGYISILNKILNKESNENRFSMSEYEADIKSKGYMKKEELIDIINMLDSDQDKFILMALFNGIAGKQLSELINLKINQVDLDKGIINLDDRVVYMDEDFKKITRAAIEQKKGIVISCDEFSLSKLEYDFNMDSEYVIKVRPYYKNNYGLSTISYAGIRTRLYDIGDYLGVDIIASSIEKSGYLYRMDKAGKEWTVAKAREWSKKEGIKVDGNNLLKLYKLVY